MLRYETHQGEIDKIFNLINTGRFYSLTFIKKGDGQIRYLNGKRHIYQKPDGTEGVVKNVGYDPKNHNLIRIWDRNAENPITKQRTGNYRSAALENILFVKSGGDIFDFVEENEIIKRFPYIERQIPQIKAKMKIEDIVDDEMQSMMQEMWELEESPEIYGIPQLAQVIANINGEEGIDGPYYEGALDVLVKAFRYGGDEAVQKEFKNNTDKDLDVISKGKYAII